MIETFIGVVLPLLITAGVARFSSGEDPGWKRVCALEKRNRGSAGPPKASRVPALIVAWSMGGCSLMMLALIFVNEQNRGALAGFAGALAVVSAATLFLSRNKPSRKTQ